MLRFFRKIRKKLIFQTKLPKYVLYAIGEILLVVIGILLALQVNNINENRKKAQLEIQYLENIVEELDINLAECENQIKEGLVFEKKAQIILDLLNRNENDGTVGELCFAIVQLPWYNPVNVSQNVWNELYATGNIGLIKNSEIKKGMTSITRTVEFYLDLEEEFQSYYLEFRKLSRGVLDAELKTKISNEKLSFSPSQSFKWNYPTKDKIRSKLESRESIEEIIADIVISRTYVKTTFEKIKRQATDLKYLIESELNQ